MDTNVGTYGSNIRDFEREDSEPINNTENNLAQNFQPSEFDVEKQDSSDPIDPSRNGFDKNINVIKVSWLEILR